MLKKLEKQGFIEGSWDEEKKSQKIYRITNKGIEEFEHKKELLKSKIEEALEVFKIIKKDLYD